MEKQELINQLLYKKGEHNNTMDLNAYAIGLEDMYNVLIFPNKETIYCGKNITTCTYFDKGECTREESECRDQIIKSDSIQTLSLSDKQLNDIIYQLDDYATRTDKYCYGLPLNDQDISEMRHQIICAINYKEEPTIKQCENDFICNHPFDSVECIGNIHTCTICGKIL